MLKRLLNDEDLFPELSSVNKDIEAEKLATYVAEKIENKFCVLLNKR